MVGKVDILGLRRAQAIIDAAIAGLPDGSPSRVALEQVSRFARLAADNLDVSKPILASIGSPVRVRETAVGGGSDTRLDVFGVEVAVVISLMFVTLLLAAGMLALEREEHAFGRLVRGLVSRTGLLVEKVALAALCAWALAGGDARGARGLARPRVGARARLAARAGGRRGGLRGARRGRRGRDARGPGRLAAGLHARAADRRAGPDPVRAR